MSRRNIHYWKCDRPAAFHGTQTRGEPDARIEQQLAEQLRERFRAEHVELQPAGSQGNHLTWTARVGDLDLFVRVENGPELDQHLAVESALLDRVRTAGVATPRVFGCDASRSRVPFAWQALERVSFPDLNHWHRLGQLNAERIAYDIGVNVARWQTIQTGGFGPFDLEHWRSDGGLAGYHATYPDYFHLRLEEHLAFLVTKGFLSSAQRDDLRQAITKHTALLALTQGCLVHRDLALWNILGTADQIHAFIDFDDAISGDPMDDLSILACFHDAAFLQRVFAGYTSLRPLPLNHRRRFWLHLLRNMIVKAVIRVGAGYFDRDNRFFLIGSGCSGADLRRFTEQRLALALRGLEQDAQLSCL
jgi:fructosamine-3-kinase